MNIENLTGLSETEQDSIRRSLGTITGTMYGSCPYRREMGLKNLTPKVNSPIKKNEYISDVMTQCEEWEDRVTVENVIPDEDGETKVVIGYDKS